MSKKAFDTKDALLMEAETTLSDALFSFCFECVQAMKTRTPQKPNLLPGQMVRMYLEDHPQLGSGERYLLVLTVGHKWITFFYIPLLATVKMKPEEYLAITRDKTVSFPGYLASDYLHKLLLSKGVLFDLNQMQYSQVNAALAERLLRKE